MGSRIKQNEIDNLYDKLRQDNLKRGYYLNPEEDIARGLVESLLINEERYGYQACPCRLAKGTRDEDRDIICPCYYRDPDLFQYGTCYCGLYVSRDKHDKKDAVEPIPERRPRRSERIKIKNMPLNETQKKLKQLSYPILRYEVCGYICARNEPPDICPICGATKDRFSRFA